MPTERITHTHIGGQAVLEGVMMRGKYNWAIAVRQADRTIHVEQHELPSAIGSRGWKDWPVVRGIVALYDTMVLAMQAFTISATYAGIGAEGSDGEGEGELGSALAGETLSTREIALSLGLGLVVAVALFVVFPAVVTNLVAWAFPAFRHSFAWNILDGVLRILVFFAYIWGVGRLPDIQRLFSYHGAEHKTIHAYEHGLPLETGPIQQFETMHVRCGTSFLLMVMIVAILVFSLIPQSGIYGNIVFKITLRILLIPLIAGLAYEVIRFAGKHASNPFIKVLLWPGLMMQKMTTNEPDDSMVEVAVMAVRPVLEREEVGEPLFDGEWTPPELRDVAPEGPADDVATHEEITVAGVEPAHPEAGTAEEPAASTAFTEVTPADA